MGQKIKVAIADDHALIRDGYKAMLKEDAELEVVGCVGNGKELIELLKKKEVDVILLDIEMPVMDGDEALGIVKKRFPEVRVIIVSMYYSDIMVREILAKGADAYLPKNVPVETLFKAIHSVNLNGQYIDEATSSALYRELKREKISHASAKFQLTLRESDILKLICLGKKTKEIADILKVEPRTITFHKKNLMTKTGSSSTAELAIYAIKKGVIALEDYRPTIQSR